MLAGLAVFVAAVMFFTPLFATSAYASGQTEKSGSELFEWRCSGCHAPDRDKEGPRLRGVFGRKSGSVPTFRYSDALTKAGVTWDEAALDKWLTNPDAFIADSDMDFQLARPEERALIIAYLKRISGK